MQPEGDAGAPLAGPLALAAGALAQALADDPFYQSITASCIDHSERLGALRRYFDYSLAEAQRSGRCVLAPDPALGAAAWLLPRRPQSEASESAAKSAYLTRVLGGRGWDNYRNIVRYMAPRAASVVPPDAWYLSILGILPSAQGRGLGAALLAGTLAEACRAGVTCYLETFEPRNLRFYERLGFAPVARHVEPTTRAEYVVMRRD